MSKELLEQMKEEIRVFFEEHKKKHAGKKLTPHQIAFDEPLRSYRDLKNVLDTAAMEARERAAKRAVEEGFAIGVEKGREEGEFKKALQIAAKMLARGDDDQTIADFTDLTLDQIQTLREQYK